MVADSGEEKCRFCASPAVAVFALSQGCFCAPDEREHSYCGQHILDANPLGGMELVRVLDEARYHFLLNQFGNHLADDAEFL